MIREMLGLRATRALYQGMISVEVAVAQLPKSKRRRQKASHFLAASMIEALRQVTVGICVGPPFC